MRKGISVLVLLWRDGVDFMEDTALEERAGNGAEGTLDAASECVIYGHEDPDLCQDVFSQSPNTRSPGSKFY